MPHVALQSTPAVAGTSTRREGPHWLRTAAPVVTGLTLGECLLLSADADRAQVAWPNLQGETVCCWLPILRGIQLRPGDQVLLQQPINAEGPIVMGAIGEANTHPGEVRLAAGETLQVRNADGTPLVQIRQQNGAAELRLSAGDAALDVPGKLSLRAEEMSFCTRSGDLRLEAADDVVARGKLIRLN